MDNDDEYINDSNSKSSFSDISMHSEDALSNNDGDSSVDTHQDFPVPNVKANSPSWTETLQGVDVPAFQKSTGPALPDNFSDTSHPADYFKLFFTEELIESFVKYTDEYARFHINKKQNCSQLC